MTSEWERAVLSDVVSLQRGHDLPSQIRRPGGVPVVGSFGITGWHDEVKASGPGVTIGRSGASIGTAVYVDGDYWPLNTCLYVKDFKGNDPRWVFHLLDLIDFSAYNSGSAQPSLNRNFLAQIPIRVPSVDEQRRIASVLGALDDLIEANDDHANRLVALARAQYDKLQALGADLVSFSSTVSVLTGGTPKTTEPAFWGGDIPWYSVVDAPQSANPWVSTTTKFVTDEGVARSATQVLPVGTTIISARGTVGKLALVGVPMAMNQSCYGLRSAVGERGIFGYFAAQDVVEQLRQGAHGSVFDTITKDSLARVSVELPPREAIWRFEKATAPTLELARELAQQNTELSRIRDALLPLLMAGKVRVSEDLVVA